MSRKLDKIIVVDLECTCWTDDDPLKKQTPMEIIEIGICLLDIRDNVLNIDKSNGFIIKPSICPVVSDFCADMTSLTQEDINNGVSLKHALNQIKTEYGTKERTWCSWGDFDRRQLDRECKSKNIVNPFGVTHLNVKNLFALQRKLTHEVGMDKALEIEGIPLLGHHHRGKDDAFNIARLLGKLIG